MNFINLTPHTIKVLKNDTVFEFPPSGVVARVLVKITRCEPIDDFKVTKSIFGEIENLPTPQDDTTYIVSQMVLGRVKDRSDVVAPDTGLTAIRNEAGQIEYVSGFVV